MSGFDSYCTVCGELLNGWLTESGDRFVVQPCSNHCSPNDPNRFETEEDFPNDDEEDFPNDDCVLKMIIRVYMTKKVFYEW